MSVWEKRVGQSPTLQDSLAATCHNQPQMAGMARTTVKFDYRFFLPFLVFFIFSLRSSEAL